MSTYMVRAKRWEHGWELHIDGIGVTQSRTLDGAERMVRDYIGSLTGRDASGDVVEIRPDLGGLEDKAAAVREWVERTQRESREAAAESRKVARELREAGLSVSDAATVLGVSRGRISQLGKAEHLSAAQDRRPPGFVPGRHQPAGQGPGSRHPGPGSCIPAGPMEMTNHTACCARRA
jgi:hypothetical protein